MTTIFTRIIDGELPGHFVWSDDRCVAFLSINPMAGGHTLVVPRVEIDQWTDLPGDLADHLFTVARRIGVAQLEAFACERIGLFIAGFEVPHVHLHVIPANAMADLDLCNMATSVADGELEAAASSLRAALERPA